MIRRAARLVLWLTLADVALGVVYNGGLVGGTWRTCTAVAQHPTRQAATACGGLAKASVTQGLPWVSHEIVGEAQIIWHNARQGRNSL